MQMTDEEFQAEAARQNRNMERELLKLKRLHLESTRMGISEHGAARPMSDREYDDAIHAPRIRHAGNAPRGWAEEHRFAPYVRADLVPTWQPIETAPKDGRVIIGWWNSEYAETITYRNGEWQWSNDGDSWLRGGPTHWMPLPAPPQPEER